MVGATCEMLQDLPDLGRADLERLHDMEGAGAWRKGKTRARRKKSYFKKVLLHNNLLTNIEPFFGKI